MIKRKVLTNTTPEVVIEIDGNIYKVDTITSVKTIKLEFILDTPYEHDPGTGETGKYVTSLENNDLVTKKVDSNEVIVKREFSDAGMIVYMYGEGITATRTFKRA